MSEKIIAKAVMVKRHTDADYTVSGITDGGHSFEVKAHRLHVNGVGFAASSAEFSQFGRIIIVESVRENEDISEDGYYPINLEIKEE